MKIKPLFDRVVIKEEQQEKTESGIILGKMDSEAPKVGEVIYVGEGNLNDDNSFTKMIVQVGDKVLYNKFSGFDISLKGETFFILRQTDILAIIE